MGLVVNNYPPIFKPKERTTDIPIPGRAGTLTVLEGNDVYDSYVRACQCYTRPTANLTKISEWLKGNGDAVFGNEPTMAYKARIDGQISMDKILPNHPHRSFNIPFVCQPFKYMANPSDYVVTSGQSIVNIGSVPSQPWVVIEGSGDISLIIGSNQVDFSSVEGGIIMDCEAMDCYDLAITSLINSKMSGDFPRLAVGPNQISWTGTVTKVTIRPRWRWI
jgi:phage-related protein